MARPAVTHNGFLIPNASGVSQPVLAEPDQIDFNTLANAQWGVIEGCEVNSQSNKIVAISDGIAIVNGKLIKVVGNSLPLPTPGANGQFVLIVVDDGGTLKVNATAPASLDPVFPDTRADETVLASVYCDSTSATFANNIVDKRKMLSRSLLTKIATTAELIRNANNVGNHFLARGDGRMTWEDDTVLYRSAEATLRVEDNLVTANDLTVEGDGHVVGGFAADGVISARNFRHGASLPGTATNGDLFVQTSTGNLFIWFGGWQQFASVSMTQGVVPIGTVIYSMQVPSVMRPLGWFPLNGTETINEADRPTIFSIATGGTITGTAPNRVLTLPDLNRRTMIVDFKSPHSTGGLPSNLLTLALDQMPQHDHNVGGTTGRTGADGKHTPGVSVAANSGAHANHTVTGGLHDHPVYDPGHTHNGMDWYGVAAPIIAQVDFDGTPKNGRNKLDAMFNDSSHTYTVEPVRWTMKATTGIDIGPNHEHGHSIGGGTHNHSLTIDEVPAHSHLVSEQTAGLGKAIDITPLNFTTYAYIRA